jgi:hypothetical protein
MLMVLSMVAALAVQPPSPQASPVAGQAAVDLSGPKPATIRAYAETVAMREAGIARTSVDKRFSEDDKVMGSLGFLCGLQPTALDKGSAAAYGVDPQGRFVGAKLKLAF